MFTGFRRNKKNLSFFSGKAVSSLMFSVVSIFLASSVYSQQVQTQYFSPNPQNPLSNSALFRQEIARMEITVTRAGKQPLSLTQVPRVQKDDVIKLRLLNEAVNGIKIDQSQWDWTLLVAFINPLHKMVDSPQGDKEGLSGTVSEEIQFRKRGWYKEYSFVVPYDSQPVFFLYPKPKYRKQLMKVVNSKYEEIRKLGEKTIELANAYSKINTFVNEMQMVLNRNAMIYGYNNSNNNSSTYNPYGSTYNPYGSTYNPYGSTYNPYGVTGTNNSSNVPVFGLQAIPALNHLVEGLAKSFNIQLPSCWNNGVYGSNYGNGSGSYSPYGSGYSGYNSGSYSSYGSGFGYGSGYGQNAAMMDFINRSQCVAKNVNLQDFDISVTRMWQQGGVFLAAELQRKYPQLAYYINIAAVAIDFIVKVFQKAPLRLVPTIIQSNDSQGGFNNNSLAGGGYGSVYSNSYSNNTTNSGNNQISAQTPVRISLYSDSQPREGGEYTTAYPVVVHKWQANPDPEVISLYPPILSEACLHAGTNILKSVDLVNQWSEDVYSRDFRLVMSASNGFKKEFPLRKNMGLGGWELNITPEDLKQIPKINMALEAEVVGMRGFNEIKSPKFHLPLSIGGTYEVTPESQKNFAVGGKRTITLRNTLGSCRCVEAVIYKPSTGGQFVFENTTDQNASNGLTYSIDGREVSFVIDTANFQEGAGVLEVKTYGNENQPTQYQDAAAQSPNNLPLRLYPAPPFISDVKVGRGDREIIIVGDRLDQLQAVSINGKRAIVKGSPTAGQNGTANGQTNAAANQSVGQPPISAQNQWGVPLNQTTPSSPSSTVMPGQLQSTGSSQRIAVFEDRNTRINSKTITLELFLEDNRTISHPQQYTVGISRPTIQASVYNEVEGIFLDQPLPSVQADQTAEAVALSKAKNKNQRTEDSLSQINLSGYPVVSVGKNAMTLAVQNILTDYSFKNENLAIETRIEDATTNPNDLPSVKFDVLDSNNLRLNFILNPTVNRNLSGRRLQFRIIDRERGNSDWYSIKQTFIRMPQIDSVMCGKEMNNQCDLKGDGLDYIAQVSVDGGRSWIDASTQIQPTTDGKTVMRIPLLINPKFLLIKLRDYPQTEGLAVSKFRYANRVMKTGKTPAQ